MHSVFFFFAVLIKISSSNVSDQSSKDSNACHGKKQSPIDIQDWNSSYNELLTPFNFINYDKDLSWNCSHNGHTGALNTLNKNYRPI